MGGFETSRVGVHWDKDAREKRRDSGNQRKMHCYDDVSSLYAMQTD